MDQRRILKTSKGLWMSLTAGLSIDILTIHTACLPNIMMITHNVLKRPEVTVNGEARDSLTHFEEQKMGISETKLSVPHALQWLSSLVWT